MILICRPLVRRKGYWSTHDVVETVTTLKPGRRLCGITMHSDKMRSRQGQSDRAQGHERIDCESMNCVGKINTVRTDNYVRQTFRDHIGDKNHDVPISAETEAPNLHWAADVSSINGLNTKTSNFTLIVVIFWCGLLSLSMPDPQCSPLSVTRCLTRRQLSDSWTFNFSQVDALGDIRSASIIYTRRCTHFS